jgi:hypothetical protein
MAADEPACRVMFNRRYLMGCKACMTNAIERRWRNPQPCDQCSRLVYRERPPRKNVRHFGRRALHNANYRRNHPRPRIERECESCSKMFNHKRSDAKFCSVACGEREYRSRLRRGDRRKASVGR